MLKDSLKNIEEYTREFVTDYELIIEVDNETRQKNLFHFNQAFEIYTLYTDTTPVQASNTSKIIK